MVLSGACVLAGCASMVAVPVTPAAGRLRLALRDHPRLDRPGGSLKLRPEGFGSDLYVLALEDGTYAALSPVCKHQGCIVDIVGERLVCPCHGSTYGRDGRVLRGPTTAPLDRFPVEVSPDGVLTIALDRTR